MRQISATSPCSLATQQAAPKANTKIRLSRTPPVHPPLAIQKTSAPWHVQGTSYILTVFCRAAECLSRHYVVRSSVGRNLASMELLTIVSSKLRCHEFVFRDPDKPVRARRFCAVSSPTGLGQLDTHEGFLGQPVACTVGIQERMYEPFWRPRVTFNLLSTLQASFVCRIVTAIHLSLQEVRGKI